MLDIILSYIGLIAIGVAGLVVFFFGGLGNSQPIFIGGFGILSGAWIFLLNKIAVDAFNIENTIGLFVVCGILGIIAAIVTVKHTLFK